MQIAKIPYSPWDDEVNQGIVPASQPAYARRLVADIDRGGRATL
jgi:hypothetical protein